MQMFHDVIERSLLDPASTDQSAVFIVDDDPSICAALSGLFRSVGLPVATFGSVRELLQSKLPDVASCLILDVRLPGQSGLDFQADLLKAKNHIPIIFMTGHGDVSMAVRAMKTGAIDFLTKPFREQDMLDAVTTAIERDRERRKAEKMVAKLRCRFETLSARERDVLGLVAAGLLNKQIAQEIGLAEITVKLHRGHLMRKMGARSLADLVRMAEILGVYRARANGGIDALFHYKMDINVAQAFGDFD